MDSSQTRRGQVCWHKLDDVKFLAVNDSLMIEQCMYTILKKDFSHLPSYCNLIELFHEATLITSIGQSLDMKSATCDVNDFTMDLYNAIAENKTSFYSFYFPIACAMHLAG